MNLKVDICYDFFSIETSLASVLVIFFDFRISFPGFFENTPNFFFDLTAF